MAVDAPRGRTGPGYGDLWRDRDFRFLFLSGSAGDTGYAVYSIAILWLAYRVSGNLGFAGLVLFAEVGIYSLSFLVGPLVDRVRDLRNVLVVGYPVQGLLAFLIGWLDYDHALTETSLLGLVVTLSVVWDLTWTASQAALPRVVDGPQLFRATGLMGAVGGGNQIAGYAAGAGLILLVGPAGAAFLYAVLNVAAGLLALPVRAVAEPAPPGRYYDRLLDGWRYLAEGAGRPRLQLLGYAAAQGFFSAAPALLIAFVAEREFGDPAAVYGLLFTAFAIGGVAGSLAIGQLNPRRHLTQCLVGVGVAEGILVGAATWLAPALLPSLATWFLVGAVDVGFVTGYVVYFQATTPPPLVARTVTDAYFPRGAARAVGSLVVGSLAAMLAPAALGAVVGAAFVAVALAGPLLLPGVRRLAF